MKRSDLDLNILDHADEATLLSLSDIPLAGESEKRRILEKSISKYEQRVGAASVGAPSDSVEGVESYRRPKWYVTMSSIAAVLSLGVGIAAISHIMHSPSPVPPQDPLLSTESTNDDGDTVTAMVPGTGTVPADTYTGTFTADTDETTDTSDTTAETGSDTTVTTVSADTTVTPAPGLYAVELHSANYPYYTKEQILDIIRAGNADYAANGPRLIDRSIYIGMIHDAKNTSELNTLEIKSYIYHMMLNTTDYFTTASGTVYRDITDEGPYINHTHSETSFAIDTDRDISKWTIKNSDCDDSIFSANRKQYLIGYAPEKESTVISVQSLPAIAVKMEDFRYTGGDPLAAEVHNISTNDRYFNTPDPSVNYQKNYTARILNNTVGSLGLGEQCLEPGTEAIDYLPNFVEWEITGTDTVAGRECVVISNSPEYASSFSAWTFYVDIEYGFLMKQVSVYDYGDYTETITVETSGLSIGSDYFGDSSAEYGTVDDSNYIYGLPDYIYVTNSQGISGYILRDDLIMVPPITSQEDALYNDNSVNLDMYDRETGAIIGKFTVNSNN